MHNEHWKNGHQHLFQYFEFTGQNSEKPPSYKLQVLLRIGRATALITQKIEREDKENTER